ncbi:hypothetical protein BDA96_08G029800 [Sorghum bicolor]|uniref:Uncharacterized protein n=1 Tax=Sorghum bicolor TaxID=4558 RepID=A0A921QFR4_SORBI|nr:hypothetical protein BDA96_08G029800 [Sorghum bicolor]
MEPPAFLASTNRGLWRVAKQRTKGAASPTDRLLIDFSWVVNLQRRGRCGVGVTTRCLFRT